MGISLSLVSIQDLKKKMDKKISIHQFLLNRTGFNPHLKRCRLSSKLAVLIKDSSN